MENNQPMGPSDIKFDFVTGTPFPTEPTLTKEDSQKDPLEEQKRKLERAVSQHHELISDLSGDGGIIVRKIVGLFSARLNELAEKDPECVAYMKALGAVQRVIDIGEKTVTNMAEDLLKYAAPAGDTGKK